MPRRRPKQMTTSDIGNYFAQIGGELTAAGVRDEIEVLLVGGAWMLSEDYPIFTEDIDVWPRNIPATTDDDASENPLTQALAQAVDNVARKNKLDRHYFNDDAALFMREYLRPDRYFYKRFGPLVVYKPSKACILASKLMIARPKDLDDARALIDDLGITTREQAQAILDRYVSNRLMQHKYEAPRTLHILFD